MSLTRALVLKRSGVTLFALWTFFACGGRDNAEVYSADGGLLSCGNGQVDAPEEECDPSASALPDGADCASATEDAAPNGTLKCAKNCTFDTSDCRRPGSSSGTGGLGTAGMMNNGGMMGSSGRNNGGFGGTSFGGQNGGGTMGMGGRNNGGTMGMGTGGRGGRRGSGGSVQTGGRQGAGGSPTDAGQDSGPITDAGLSCTGSGDCGSGRVCCGTIAGGQYTGFSCQASCGTGDTVVDCGKPSDCGSGQVCCGAQTVSGGTRQYTSLSCQPTCNGQDEFVLCTSNANCSNGLTCQGSQYLPAPFRVCR